MAKAKVFFSDFSTGGKESLPQKLLRLLHFAGMDQIGFEKKFTAIKVHFGEPGNVAYVRPNFVKVVADDIQDRGGLPFLTDCNTLYVGRRKNALDHLGAAYENGFNPFTVGCHIIIGDGLKGTDEILLPVQGDYVREAKVGRAVADADILVTVNHFKAHEITGIGGAIKNIGMGCGSRAGKMEMHSSAKPQIEEEKCILCRVCAKNCAHDAITFSSRSAMIDESRCVGCGRCIGGCIADAVHPGKDDAFDVTNRKISEYTHAVLQGKPHFHISFLTEISPFCDCHNENDVPIVANIGMLASADPVAIDCAAADLVNERPVNPDSILAGKPHHGDHFTALHPKTDWREGLLHAEKMGVGVMRYELIPMKNK